ncbi:MAG: tetratricopeptide repeat protein, partial [Candidatus Heimdallarchaeota archaeon]
MAELTGEANHICETKLKQLLKSQQIRGNYSDYNQVFISQETPLFCQVHGGKFVSSYPHHTCPACGRNICWSCIGQLMDVGLVVCVYCETEFDPRPLIHAMISSNDMKVKKYGEGLNSMDTGNFRVAVETFGEYVQSSDEDVSGLFELAFSLNELKKFEKAIPYWEKINRISPRHVKTLIHWGNALQELGDYKGALEKYQQANRIQPRDIMVLMNW